jgi:hypothetical protein
MLERLGDGLSCLWRAVLQDLRPRRQVGLEPVDGLFALRAYVWSSRGGLSLHCIERRGWTTARATCVIAAGKWLGPDACPFFPRLKWPPCKNK